jgi:membrane fusion protein, multidrug efflux system
MLDPENNNGFPNPPELENSHISHLEAHVVEVEKNPQNLSNLRVSEIEVIPEPLPSSEFKLESKPASKTRLFIFGAIALAVITLGTLGYRWWSYATIRQETDNAYITTHLHPVSSRITGTVSQVLVSDNQFVQVGTPLVQLDRQDYEIALQQAKANLENVKRQANVAKANIQVSELNAQGKKIETLGNFESAQAAIATAQANLSEAQATIPARVANLAAIDANLSKARLDDQRNRQLLKEGAIAQQQVDATRAIFENLSAQRGVAQAQIVEAQARVTQAQTNLENTRAKLSATAGTQKQAESNTQQTEVNRNQYQVALAAIAKAEIDVKNAQLQLSYTQVRATNAGKVGNKTVEVGQRLSVGQPLMAIVQASPWVVANFKETQLEKMRSGQEVEIKIDAFPSHIFKGKVDSFAPASGARFSLLPPDNATGNFTKIVQRVPVKVVFAPESIKGFEQKITPGMSAMISVVTD